jgi:threonine dehydratase
MDHVDPSEATLITPTELHEARVRIGRTCLRTPVLEVPHPAGPGSVWVMAESLQRTGSFKLRGAANAVAGLDEAASGRGVVTYSAGNHGQALAYAARLAGIAATVVMPLTAPQFKIDGTRALGATVVLRPPDEIVPHAHALADARGLTLVPPFEILGSSPARAPWGSSCSTRSTRSMRWWRRSAAAAWSPGWPPLSRAADQVCG